MSTSLLIRLRKTGSEFLRFDRMNKGKLNNNFFFILLLFAGMGLLSGLYAGLVRIGVIPKDQILLSGFIHGPLMINGFLGTLIGLERSAALEKVWAYFTPVLMAAATVLFLFQQILFAKWLFLWGSISFLVVLLYLYRLQSETYHLIMAFGGFSLVIGNILFLMNLPIADLVMWWAGFPMLTIFGERLELNRIMRPPKRAQNLFFGFIVIWIIGIILIYFSREWGWLAASVALIAIAVWLIRYDVARRTIRSIQWTKYSAICLLSGYGWLVITGITGIWKTLPYAGLFYDAMLHMIFVGFIFSMIFAHASVIIPSLSGLLIPFHGYFYLPLGMLHGFLIIRIVGDLLSLNLLRQIGGYGNVAAILLFLGGVITQLLLNQLRKRSHQSPQKVPNH
jgi:hypothetical protein